MIYTHYPQLPDLMNGVLRDRVSAVGSRRSSGSSRSRFSFARAVLHLSTAHRAYWSRADRADRAGALGRSIRSGSSTPTICITRRTPRSSASAVCTSSFATCATSSAVDSCVASGVFLFLVVPRVVRLLVLHAAAARDGDGRSLPSRATGAAVRDARESRRRSPSPRSLFKFGTNAWALGGVRRFFADLRFQCARARDESGANVSYRTAGFWPTLYGRVERCFSAPALPGRGVLGRRCRSSGGDGRASSRDRRRATESGLLLLAALPFLCCSPSSGSRSTTRRCSSLPFYAVACAAIVVLLLETTASRGRSRGRGAARRGLVVELDRRERPASRRRSSTATRFARSRRSWTALRAAGPVHPRRTTCSTRRIGTTSIEPPST